MVGTGIHALICIEFHLCSCLFRLLKSTRLKKVDCLRVRSGFGKFPVHRRIHLQSEGAWHFAKCFGPNRCNANGCANEIEFSATNGRPSDVLHFVLLNRPSKRKLPFHSHKTTISGIRPKPQRCLPQGIPHNKCILSLHDLLNLQ